MSIKVFQDSDTDTVKYNNNMSIPNQNFKIVQSNDKQGMPPTVALAIVPL